MEEARIAGIRKAERDSHIEMYTNTPLFTKGTWLGKPVQTVLDCLTFFENRDALRILDLGCGVGRNCIPIAQKFHGKNCWIDCVDILDLAINKLYEYSAEYQVRSCMHGSTVPLEYYPIPRDSYDFIFAVSSLEHVNSVEVFYRTLEHIRDGIRPGGVVCFVINSNIAEAEKTTGERRDAQFEVNLPTQALTRELPRIFSKWKILKHTIVPQQYDIPRDTLVHLTADVVTWVVQRQPV